MSILNFHSQVISGYRDFVHSYFTIAADRAQAFVDHAMDTEAWLAN